MVLVCGFLAALRFAIHGNWIPAFPAGMTAIGFGGLSLGLGLPIFAFAANYNKETTENAAEYFSDADELMHLIVNANAESLLTNGLAMSAIATRRYQWQGIVAQYAGLLD